MSSVSVLERVLCSLGCDESAQNVYIYCMQYQGLSVTQLARLLKKPRSTLYASINWLVDNQFMYSIKQSKNTIYLCYGLGQLQDLVRERQIRFDSLYQDLNHLDEHEHEIFLKSGYHSGIKHYEGSGFVSVLYSEFRKAEEFYAFFDIAHSLQYTNLSLKEVIKSGALIEGNAKEILVNSPEALQYKQAVESKTHQVKLRQYEGVSFSCDFFLYQGNFVHIAFGQHTVGFEIKDSSLYTLQKSLFDIYWKSL